MQVGSAIFSFDFVSVDLWELSLHKGFTERLRLQKTHVLGQLTLEKQQEGLRRTQRPVTLGLGEFENTLYFEEVKRTRTAAQDDRRKLTQKLRAKQIVRGSRTADQTVLHCVTGVRCDEPTRRALCLLTSPMQKRMQCRIV